MGCALLFRFITVPPYYVGYIYCLLPVLLYNLLFKSWVDQSHQLSIFSKAPYFLAYWQPSGGAVPLVICIKRVFIILF